MDAIRIRASARLLKIKDINNSQYFKKENEPGRILIGDENIFRVNVMGIIINKNESESAQTITIDDGTGNIDARTFEMINSFDELDIGDIVSIIGKPREYGRKYILIEIVRKVEDPKWPEFFDMLAAIEKKNKQSVKEAENTETNTQTLTQNAVQQQSTQPTVTQPNESHSFNQQTKTEKKDETNNDAEYDEIDVSELIKPKEDNSNENNIEIRDKDAQLKEKVKNFENEMTQTNKLLDIIRKMDTDDGADYDDIAREFGEGIDENIVKLLESGDIYEFRPRKYKVLE